MDAEKISSATLWDWVKAVSVLVLVVVSAIKIYNVPATLSLDLPTLLALLLAIFAIWLSALFYFKAAETSNAFYDNTYKFTKDIAELLVKIESGFGERLRHLDEGYSSMRDYLQSSPARPNADVDATKEKLESERQEVEKVIEERNQIVQRLIERAQLHAEEKLKVQEQLKEKEHELARSQAEIAKLNRRLTVDRVARHSSVVGVRDLESGVANFTYEMVVKRIGPDKVLDAPIHTLRREMEVLKDDLPKGYIRDLTERGLFADGGLTRQGATFLKAVAERYREK